MKDKQALREAAERAIHDDWGYDTDIFHEQVTPSVVLALLDECAAMTAKLSMINDLMEAAEQVNKLAQEAAEKLVQECNALAAENAGLKALIPENWRMHDVLHQLIVARPGGVYFNKWETLIIGMLNETPATDTFLAEVRAQGVEMFAKHCQKRHGEMMKSEPNEASSNEAITATRRAGEFALYFAAQLRKGAAL
ncbi:hypothetical protein ACNKWM_005059 [Salmonella enterica subsp. diarizonae serovar 16:z10:e,n,x,z15]